MGRGYAILVFGGFVAIGVVGYAAGELSGDTTGKTTTFAVIGAHSPTAGGRRPRSRRRQAGGRLRAPADAPASVRETIGRLRPAACWRGLQSLRGGSEGIVVLRKPGPENGWLWDLWLAERLAATLGA